MNAVNVEIINTSEVLALRYRFKEVGTRLSQNKLDGSTILHTEHILYNKPDNPILIRDLMTMQVAIFSFVSIFFYLVK